MQKRKIGTLEVSALGFGCMGMTSAYGPPAGEAIAGDLQDVAAALARIEVQGDRLPEAVLKMTGL